MKKTLIIILLAMLIGADGAHASGNDSVYHDRPGKFKRASALLGTKKTAADSVGVLLDMLDLADYSQYLDVTLKLYQTALRANNDKVALEALRKHSNHFSNTYNDSMQAIDYELAKKISPSENQREATIFIKLQMLNSRAYKMPANQLQDSLEISYERYNATPMSQPELRAERLFEFSIYLSHITQSEILTDVYDNLLHHLGDLPRGDGSLKSLFYTVAANAYSRNGLTAKAIEADRNLLSIIDTMKDRYASEGRVYRTFDRSLYNCYRRLLSNYRGLNENEWSTYYNRILTIISRDHDLKNTYSELGRARIYYLMARKEYPEALALLKKHIDDEKNSYHRDRFMVLMIEAAEATDDRDALFWATREYNRILEQRMQEKSAERVREIQLLYYQSSSERKIAELQAEKALEESEASRRLLWISIGVAIVFFTLVIALLLLLRRTRRYARKLTETNRTIRADRDNMRQIQKELIIARDRARDADRVKTDFINNMSHEVKTPLNAISEYTRLIVDCMDDENRRYLRRYADIVTKNTELILTLVNDVLEVAESDNSQINVIFKPVSVKSVCNVTLETISKTVSPGVTLEYINAHDSDITVTTDSHRVEQVLLNMLSNAAKFTSSGSIRLQHTVDRAANSISFIVEDTGIGIPRGKEEFIFERFEKLDYSSPGYGLGLYICRLMANILGGVIYLDPSYRHGARFIFTIPVSPRKNDSDNGPDKPLPQSEAPDSVI